MRKQTKQGAASIFVVIFTTLLLGVITLSFVRIMISEAEQTTNYDLSQSAYDSALAGIEDAKVALLKYHECLNQGATSTTGSASCQEAIRAITAENSKENCDIISEMLSRPHVKDQETIIQSEDYLAADGESTNTMEQAYTCVKIAENTDDYLGRLNQNYRTKIIPVRVSPSNLSSLNRIKLEWYNAEDQILAGSNYAGTGSGSFTTNKIGYGTSYTSTNIFGKTSSAPPTVQMQLIQTDAVFNLAQFSTNSGSNTNQGTLTLRPSSRGTNIIGNSTTTGLASSADKSINNPIDISCNNSNTYSCTADIVVPTPIQSSGDTSNSVRDEATMFIRLVLPYAAPETSFSVKLYSCPNDTANTKDCSQIEFVGVQAKVDSTGRANDLFRRVESRVELVDTYFPYPEFTTDLNGGDDDSIWKNYWITRNCWTTGGTNKGTYCDNSGVAKAN
ncbi:MAG: hypothetical protein ACK5MU_00605 [Candidatus Saccharimonadales bacterium]